ncbi:hypothetical protein [Pelagicoccus mobilis]|uniref:Uncharacterized protein n=1 Tax=Pelagicoccus mobilis TaxID=415221 RepID=A0A934VLR0_9BACT|nr:hypothetical protein [Pelagicoccus mobilis]MBK1878031.1 hypothetical protein [Pelagicoccus mobilis]
MKLLTALLSTAIATLSLSASSIPVHLDPDAETPVIGALEAVSLAVPAEWPKGRESVEGWQPVYYRGVFEVYVNNNDISKDLTAKPGSPYFLSAEKDSPTLAIATDKDKVDVLSVDTWFCKMQLETIVLGYIQDTSVAADSIVTSLAETPTVSTPSASTAQAITELVGRLEKTGLPGKKRTGTAYKLISGDGKTLAFLETADIPDRIQLGDLIKLQVRVSGYLKQGENETDVILRAKTIKKAQ